MVKDNSLSADILQEGKGIIKAVFSYTIDRAEEKTHKRIWKTVPASISGKVVSAELPPDTFQCFLSVYDEETPQNDCCGSSDLVILN